MTRQNAGVRRTCCCSCTNRQAAPPFVSRGPESSVESVSALFIAVMHSAPPHDSYFAAASAHTSNFTMRVMHDCLCGDRCAFWLSTRPSPVAQTINLVGEGLMYYSEGIIDASSNIPQCVPTPFLLSVGLSVCALAIPPAVCILCAGHLSAHLPQGVLVACSVATAQTDRQCTFVEKQWHA